MHYEQLTSPQSRYFSTRFILHHDYVSKVGAKVKLASAQKRTRPTVKSSKQFNTCPQVLGAFGRKKKEVVLKKRGIPLLLLSITYSNDILPKTLTAPGIHV